MVIGSDTFHQALSAYVFSRLHTLEHSHCCSRVEVCAYVRMHVSVQLLLAIGWLQGGTRPVNEEQGYTCVFVHGQQ